jgi:oxygen-dependent protoporphyrinogen oxidase
VHSLGLESSVRSVAKDQPAAIKRYIAINGKLEIVPTLSGKLIWDLMKEPFQPKSKTKTESLDSFFTRRLGPDVSNIASAIIHGIYAGDHSKLEIQSTFSTLAQMESDSGSIFLGVLKRLIFNNTEEFTDWSSQQSEEFVNKVKKDAIYSFIGGMQTLSDSLHSNLTDNGVEIVSGECVNFSKDKKGIYIDVFLIFNWFR